jgi:hypothetical protein
LPLVAGGPHIPRLDVPGARHPVVGDERGEGAGERVGGGDGDGPVLRAVEQEDRHVELVRPRNLVEGTPVEADPQRYGPLGRRGQQGRQPALVGLQIQNRAPVQHGGIQDQRADARAERRLVDELRDDRAPHGVAEQNEGARAQSHGVADGRVQVAPLGRAEVEQAVLAPGGARVVPIGDQQGGEAGAPQRREHSQALPTRGVVAVDEDRPGVSTTLHQPGRHAPELRAKVDLLVRDAARCKRVPLPHLLVEADLRALLEVAADIGDEAGYLLVRTGDDLAGDRMTARVVEAVDARPGARLVALERHPIVAAAGRKIPDLDPLYADPIGAELVVRIEQLGGEDPADESNRDDRQQHDCERGDDRENTPAAAQSGGHGATVTGLTRRGRLPVSRPR